MAPYVCAGLYLSVRLPNVIAFSGRAQPGLQRAVRQRPREDRRDEPLVQQQGSRFVPVALRGIWKQTKVTVPRIRPPSPRATKNLTPRCETIAAIPSPSSIGADSLR